MNSTHTSSIYHLVHRAGKTGTRCSVNPNADNGKYATGDETIKQLNLRSNQKIGTWNVKKLKEVGKLQTLRREMDWKNIEIKGISETIWNGSGSFKTCNGHTVLLAGKEEGYRI